ncbi:MAG TPA: DUF1420 family protein [Candidatus Acidoferrum sp.]|nr:DUF1420 family protein [Candidatus Acidoferrum sp.]
MFAFLVASSGAWLLRRFGITLAGAESVLYALVVGVVTLEIVIAVAEFAPNVRSGVRAAVAAICLAGLLESVPFARALAGLYARMRQASPWEKTAAAVLAAVLFLEGLAAMAPLTGSDALHYHFTAPAQILREGFRANWLDPHSFFLGQSHHLILAGLALGSERLALGLIFFGGAASAIAIVRLAREWVSGVWPWLAAICFVLTPVIFWQMTTAGAPDMWMALFAAVGVLAILRAAETRKMVFVVVAGCCAGGLAGAKYTGLLLAAALLCAFLMEMRSAAKSAIFFVVAVAAGIWPYLRNWKWTGNPVFPFLVERFGPQHANQNVIRAVLADTGASDAKSIWRLLQFPFFAAVDQTHLGFWQMLGPLVLCFAPLIILAAKNTRLWRIALVVWILGTIGIGATSGMARFTLPLLPIALAASFASVALLPERGRRVSYLAASALVAAYGVLGLCGLAVYTRPALAVATGVTSRENYLRERAPDFQATEFVNERLAGEPGDGKVLVTFSHTYYLARPFVNGNPVEIWFLESNSGPAEFYDFLQRETVKWVLRDGEYPAPQRELYLTLESQQKLVPCGSAVAQDFTGNRLPGIRVSLPLTMMCVK